MNPEHDRVLNWLIGLLTVGVLTMQLMSHSPRAQQVARQASEHIRYQLRRGLRWYRRLGEPAWKQELRDYFSVKLERPEEWARTYYSDTTVQTATPD